jgi:hypothetical protein
MNVCAVDLAPKHYGQNFLKMPLTSLLRRKMSCQVSIELPSKWGGHSPNETIVPKRCSSSFAALESACSLILWSRALNARNAALNSSDMD